LEITSLAHPFYLSRAARGAARRPPVRAPTNVERLDWQIRKAEKRLAEIEARLAKSELRERHQEDQMTATHP
jgi:hypothetical protein